MNKIITKLDANLISMTSSEVSEQTLALNELLIKELVSAINDKQLYVPIESQQLIDDYQIVKNQIQQVVAKLEVNNLSEVINLVEYLSTEIDKYIKNAEIQKSEAQLKLDNQEVEHQSQIKEVIKSKDTEIENLKSELEIYKQKYQNQKNRKIVRFIDKVARR